MTWSRVRGGAAAAAALGLVGALLWAEPAAACSCLVTDPAEAIGEGWADAAAVVTNIGSTRRPRYRVEAAYGAELPPRISPKGLDAMCGGPNPPPLRMEAMLLEQKGGCQPVTCGFTHFGQTLLGALGRPEATGEGRAVALAAGEFGASRLVALDRRGRPVAWDGQDGTGLQVSVCPGGSVVAALGHSGGTYDHGDPATISVHDAKTLLVRRSVPVPKEPGSRVAALRCADPRGDRVELLLRGGPDHERVHAVVVTGRQVRTTDLGRRGLLVATPDGFVGASSRGLARVGVDGTRTEIADEVWPPVSGVAVSLDGRTIALHSGETVWAVDLASGKRLGRWRSGKPVAGVAFTGSGRVLVRLGDWMSAEGFRSFDRAMRPLGEGRAGPGELFAAVGDSAVTYKSARLTADRVDGGRLIADELRLAGAQHVVAVSDSGFVRGKDVGPDETGDPDDQVELSVEAGDEDPGMSDELGLLGGGAAAGLVGLAFLARRRPRRF